MPLNPINKIYNFNYAQKNPSFKGIIGKIRILGTEDSHFDWNMEQEIVTRRYNSQIIDYYQFKGDSSKELDDVCSKYEFSVDDKEKPLPSTTIRFEKADASSINVIKVPLTMAKYKKYLDNKLKPEEVNDVEYILKEACLRELLKKKIALLPLGGNLYKSLYLPLF